jgi:hypothetical protein
MLRASAANLADEQALHFVAIPALSIRLSRLPKPVVLTTAGSQTGSTPDRLWPFAEATHAGEGSLTDQEDCAEG